MSGANPEPRRGSVVPVIGYVASIAVAVGLFFAIRAWGSHLAAPSPTGGARFGEGSVTPESDTLLHVLLALVVIIVASRGLGALFRRIDQPPVVGEILAGILLGPSLLGRVAPPAAAFLVPPTVAPFLGVIAQVGVVLFMFLVGLELDTSLLRGKTRAAVAISHASIVVPFLLGSTTALLLYPRVSSSDVPFGVFALFVGVSMSVTAFPVLSRILTDRGMQRTRIGVIAIGCAAVDDVTAWCLLAFVVGVARARASEALVTIGLAAGYVTFMAVLVRPYVAWVARRQELVGTVRQATVALVLVGLLLSALATEIIGIHALFGAFLLGAIIPHESRLARALKVRLEDLVVVLLLPAFFAFTGLRTQIGLLDDAASWSLCGVIVVVACVGKLGGSAVAARLSGLGGRDALTIGVLMNTRGLMELIVLHVGLELRVLSPTLFAMMVVMALVTTFATAPALAWLQRGRAREEVGAHEGLG